ncbi:hypothetical protein [Legionella bononiensis]|uniref:Uncharacterized protein n=1 Tax=Legionella bononiensis TaxID=2793102 RepID=A0ABS1W8D6_9GAMM|nr:hypothetical protein [Legionella bononiensis]MBL7479910.1 hypothetical protein [Legionella bononiensis]MBL7525575.1 hypothetical protein [Legionella bononiensis]MBL7561759.1 hypothetical protein [Legionella bononiensis]
MDKKETTKQSVSWYHLLNWSTAYRGYNALIAGLVMLEYINNPEAAAIEYLPDVAVHAFEAIAPNSLNNLAITANFTRGIQAGLAFFSGNSTIPSAANIADVFNHGLSVYRRLS